MDGNYGNYDNNNLYNNQGDQNGGQPPIVCKLSMIFGIVGTVLCLTFCCSSFGFPFGVAAIVCGVIGKNKDPENGQAKLGFILGIVAAALSLILSVVAAVINASSGILSQYLQNLSY